MKIVIRICFAAAALASTMPIQAYTVTNTSGPFTATAGAGTCATFDVPTTSPCSITGGQVGSYGLTLGGAIAIRAVGANPPTGTIENPVNVTLDGFATYLGFYTQSNDGLGNVIELYSGNTLLQSINGLSWFLSGVPKTYVNISAGPGELFDRVVFRGFNGPNGLGGATNGCCFEIDNIAVVTAIPVPAACLLLGSGLIGLVGVARRKVA